MTKSNLSEAARKAWETRRSKYGSSGISNAGHERLARKRKKNK